MAATSGGLELLRTMTEHGARRLPVIDGHELIGMVSQADVAKNLPDDRRSSRRPTKRYAEPGQP